MLSILQIYGTVYLSNEYFFLEKDSLITACNDVYVHIDKHASALYENLFVHTAAVIGQNLRKKNNPFLINILWKLFYHDFYNFCCIMPYRFTPVARGGGGVRGGGTN